MSEEQTTENTALSQLFKSIQTFDALNINRECREKLWKYNDAFMQSIHSIIDDSEHSEKEKMQYFKQSIEEYATAMFDLLPELIELAELERPNMVNPIGKSDPNRYDEIEEIEKFNPYHDRLGRFTTGASATSFTVRTKDPKKQHMADAAIAREKERQAALEADSGGKPKENLVSGLGKEHAEAVENLVQDSSQDIQNLWNKYAGEIIIENANSSRSYCSGSDGSINVNIKNDAAGSRYKPPYETVMHESGHSIDHAISRKVGYRYSERYNGGEYQDMLVKEGNEYIKNFQKKLSAERGTKVSIGDARDELGKLMRKEGAMITGDVSDMLEGVTKGKFTGSAGHGTSYWIGRNTWVGRVGAHQVCVEAFAEMFSASTANGPSLKKIKEVFPESYKIFQRMVKEANNL